MRQLPRLRAPRARRLGPLAGAVRGPHGARRPLPRRRSSLTACSGRSSPSAATPAAARPLLERCFDTATRLDVVSMGVDSAAALGSARGAGGRCRSPRPRTSISCSSAGAAARTTTTPSGASAGRAAFFAGRGDIEPARACTEALSGIASRTGHPDVLAALAHALGRDLAGGGRARGRGRTARAGRRACTRVSTSRSSGRTSSCGPARVLGAAGRREAALEHLAKSHTVATGLGAAPLAALAAEAVGRPWRVNRGAPGTAGRRRSRERRASRAGSSRSCGSSRRDTRTARSPASWC